MNKKLLLSCFFLFALLFTNSTFLQAQSFIFSEINPLDFGIDIKRDLAEPHIARIRYVRAEFPQLKDLNTLEFQLFPDADFWAEKTREEVQFGSEVWVGKIDDGMLSYVIFAQKGGSVFGKIVDPQGRTFLLQQKQPGIYAIQEIAAGVLNESIQDFKVGKPQSGQQSQPGKSVGICDLGSTCAAATVDVMVVYTPDAKTNLGGTNVAAENAIAVAVAEMNTASTNSGMIHSFNLAYAGEIAYTETGDAYTDLPRLRTYGDSYLDDAHVYRYSYQADLVALVTATSGCGLGYVQTNPTSFSAANGFCVANTACLTGNLTLAHEFGHNMGLRHDNYVDASTSPCAHNHGYVNQAADPLSADYTGNSSQRWRTILAYNNNCSTEWGFNCTRIPYWSNQSVNYNTGTGGGPGSGIDPMGIATTDPDPADNTYSLNRSICLVSDLSDQLTPLPVDFAWFEANRKAQTFLLSWATDFELNHAGFEIEMRSENVAEFSPIGIIEGGEDREDRQEYQFQTNDLLPGKYEFRIRQTDLNGTFTFSKTISGSIPFTEGFQYRFYPNPAREEAFIELSLEKESFVKIELLNSVGQRIQLITNHSLIQGNHKVGIPVSELPSGMYMYRLHVDGVSRVGSFVH